MKISFKNEGEIMVFLGEDKLRVCHQHIYPKSVGKVLKKKKKKE